jgi:hypothetical protein
VIGTTAAPASRNTSIRGDGSRIALAEPVIGRCFAPTRWLACPGRRGEIFARLHQNTPPHSRGAKTPGRCMVGSRLDNEGAGKAGRSPHPQPRVRKKAHERSHHRFAEITRPSLRNGFNGCFVLSPANRAFLPPSPAKVAFRELDTSVGVSGPHDFTVRFRAVRHRHYQRPPHPDPRFVTLRNAPLWDGTAGNIEVIWVFGKAEYFAARP